MSFNKILIANRGEIACRVIRTARALGYRTVAVYSEADADALHAEAADEAVCIGPAPARESYLNISAIIEAAAATQAGAVHPGYGFLSENADFARACQKAGLVFIGPDPEAIAAMGNKAAAKRLMLPAGVPCVPGYQGADQSDACLLAEARRIGVPLMVKAAAGGGGRGMRLVSDLDDLPAALAAARSEALNAFGSAELILERAITGARHVEIQIFGDRHGNTIHLGERDCSIQRRHQKVIEESPSPAVDAALRARMGKAAVAAARAVNYAGAGTVEFLLGRDGAFYFLEMNTRLQVEHPVTECVTGLDLVAWQIAVAAGAPLPLAQEEICFGGHAIEARLYAEDPYAGFLPQSGDIVFWRAPSGPGVRVDHGLARAQAISPYYDPMIAKIVVHGATREEARQRLLGALRDTAVLGLPNNLDFLTAIAANPVFAAGEATTAFIEQEFGGAGPERPRPDERMVALAAAIWFDATAYRGTGASWRSAGAARWPLLLAEAERRHAVHVSPRGGGRYRVEAGGRTHDITLLGTADGELELIAGGIRTHAAAAFGDSLLHLAFGGVAASFEDVTYAPREGTATGGAPAVAAPMNGKVLAVLVKPGDPVVKGQRLAVLEAMKMEHQLLAPRDGVVERVLVREGDQAASRAVLITIAGEAAA